ncbi:MAG: glycosyltransferase family 4 protein [Deltaproteobacteria bacterium]|nr:MAG: glycosyltransferase family 4 protein [Deltaproteobacteria bacterium]
MKIAQVSPLYESVPPRLYGGTERVVSWLTEELVRQGHDVTLFASGDSVTSAKLVPCASEALRLAGCREPLAHHLLMLEEVARRLEEFDIVHYHVDYLHFPLSRRSNVPQLTTLHGRLDSPELAPLFREYRDMPLVSISNAQRRPLPFANWTGTVYHGLPTDQFRLNPDGGGYLAFLGRISPEKRPDRAIEIAKRSGLPLKIAAKVDRADQEYFEREIKPLLSHPLVEFIGEINDADKQDFLGQALALLFPIDWPEPFGLVMIEAMACGTPVVAWRCGSVPEVMENGVTGFVVASLEEAVQAVKRVEKLDRRVCRAVFERRFSSRRMAEDYVLLYRRLLGHSAPDNRLNQRVA